MNKIKNLINGLLNKKEVVTIIGKHDVGKTGFVANIVKNLAIDDNKSVAIVCTEETKENFIYRLISLVTNISIVDLKKGNIPIRDWSKLSNAKHRIGEAKIYISDNQDFSMNLDEKIDLLIIDSLSYLKIDMKKYEFIEYLKKFSTNLNCSILVTDQSVSYIPLSIPNIQHIFSLMKEEEKLVKMNSDSLITMERKKDTETITLTIASHTDKTQTIDCKFNDSTGEFTEK